MALNLDGRTALVTGGGSGICLALTKKLLAAGANVAVVDRQVTPDADEVIRAAGETRCIYVKTDVTDWKQLRAAFERTISAFGKLEIVVPGAGVLEPASFWRFGTSEQGKIEERSSYGVFDINLNHPIRATQLALDCFKRQKLEKAVITHIASIVAQFSVFPTPLYCASKHAIAGFVRSMAPLEEVGIRVNAVAPGIVKTPLWDEARLKFINEDEDVWVTTDQVADAIIDLITNQERIGGTVLEVGAEHVRAVELLNDPGPSGKGLTVGNMGVGFEDAFRMLEANFGN